MAFGQISAGLQGQERNPKEPWSARFARREKLGELFSQTDCLVVEMRDSRWCAWHFSRSTWVGSRLQVKLNCWSWCGSDQAINIARRSCIDRRRWFLICRTEVEDGGGRSPLTETWLGNRWWWQRPLACWSNVKYSKELRSLVDVRILARRV